MLLMNAAYTIKILATQVYFQLKRKKLAFKMMAE